MKKITIIGGGATGTLLAINLIKSAGDGEPLEINLIEKSERFGRGVAYSTVTDFHLLNVPANKMGAFADDLDHFHRWLTARNYDFFPNDFVPRRLYGEYLRELFAETFKSKPPHVAVNLLDDEAIDVLLDDVRAQVILRSGEVVYADKIVLAFGNFPPPHPKSENQSFIESDKYFQNPWSAAIYEKINKDDDVFVIGTGLTAVDAVLSLRHRRHAGKIFLFSTRGLLPAVHELGFVYPSFYDDLKPLTRITDLLKTVRRHIAAANRQNSNWRGVMDSLRPHTAAIWQNLPEAEKRSFMQHLSRYWNVARHRMPPKCAEIVAEMQTAGQLQILKGRLKNIAVGDDRRFDVRFSRDGVENTLAADAVINCIGSESNFRRIESTLVKNLFAKNLINTDRLKMGLDAAPDGRTIDKSGAISDRIFTIGTALKGVLWESTAMPEIRAQANKLAFSLLDGG
ncbi:MAG: FAD/NAD(P)-binding protein [Pyrinomonadaceae bacterium]|nr:FAD/NAD(P)-binding protein [Pyrinomonadaceae bacterium]